MMTFWDPGARPDGDDGPTRADRADTDPHGHAPVPPAPVPPPRRSDAPEIPEIPDGGSSMTRRTLLAGGVVVAAGLAGAGIGYLRRETSDTAGSVSAALRAAIAAEDRLLTGLSTAPRGLPPALLAALRADHRAHRQALVALADPDALAAASIPASPVSTAPAGPASDVGQAAEAEIKAAGVAGKAADTAPDPLATVLASIAACELSHAVLMDTTISSEPSRTVDEHVADRARSAVGAALQVVLAAEQRADFGYGVLGPHLARQEEKDTAGIFQSAHARQAAWCADQLAAMDQTPTPAAADYPDLYPVADDAAAVALALRLEEAAGRAWRAVFRATVTAGLSGTGGTGTGGTATVRSTAEGGLTGSAVQAVHWRGTPVAFPGT